MIEFESTIKNGLPVIVKAWIQSPEPSVGLDWGCEIYSICFLSGHEIKFKIDREDIDRLNDEAIEFAQNVGKMSTWDY